MNKQEDNVVYLPHNRKERSAKFSPAAAVVLGLATTVILGGVFIGLLLMGIGGAVWFVKEFIAGWKQGK